MEPGKVIKMLREAKGLPAGQVAAEARISPGFLSLVEKGERQPSLKVIRDISEVLQIPPEAIVAMSLGTSLQPRSRAAKLAQAVDSLREAEERLRRELSSTAEEGEDVDHS